MYFKFLEDVKGPYTKDGKNYGVLGSTGPIEGGIEAETEDIAAATLNFIKSEVQ